LEKQLLRVDHVDVCYGDAQAVWDVSFHVDQGAIVSLIGANGAGKSTLLNTISCFNRPCRGAIYFDGHTLSGHLPEEVVKIGISHVPEGRRLFTRLTVQENLELGAFQPAARKKISLSMEYAFTLFPKLRDRLHQVAGTLSGGEQQMLAIARALMARPKLLMLDEPSLGLAPLVVETMFEIIQKLNREGVTILLVEQNVHQTLQICDHAYVLQSGQIKLEGSGASLLNNSNFQNSYLGMVG
jgi:branched-chain amino acid transport system ATP-binding protein